MSERILITGGAGYIGSVLVPFLLSKNYEITVIDNFLFNQNSLLDVAINQKMTVYNSDVNNQILFKELIKRNDIIIPLAAIVGAPACNQNKKLAKEVNLEQLKFINKNISKNQKIIFPVSNSGYGVGKKDIYCDENSPLNPISLYGKLKVEAEKILLDRGNCITFRLATVFGSSPRMRIDLLVNDFVHRAVKDRFIVLFEPHFKRNYIHVRDVANAFFHGLKNFNVMKNQIYNVGDTNANLSKKELCLKIKKYVKKLTIIESEFAEDPDKRDYIVSNAKLEKTGWKRKFSLDYGIKELINLYSWLKITSTRNY